jgi:hypothetical protein
VGNVAQKACHARHHQKSKNGFLSIVVFLQFQDFLLDFADKLCGAKL